MLGAAGRACAFALASAAAGCSGTVTWDETAPELVPPKADDPPQVDAGPAPDAGPLDAGPPIDAGPTPEVCDGYPITGSGTTWLESAPTSAEQRPLRCLTSASDRVS